VQTAPRGGQPLGGDFDPGEDAAAKQQIGHAVADVTRGANGHRASDQVLIGVGNLIGGQHLGAGDIDALQRQMRRGLDELRRAGALDRSGKDVRRPASLGRDLSSGIQLLAGAGRLRLRGRLRISSGGARDGDAHPQQSRRPATTAVPLEHLAPALEPLSTAAQAAALF
jgi:hypothetical protein